MEDVGLSLNVRILQLLIQAHSCPALHNIHGTLDNIALQSMVQDWSELHSTLYIYYIVKYHELLFIQIILHRLLKPVSL